MFGRVGEDMGEDIKVDAEEDLIEALAKRLHDMMEHLDPTGGRWESIDDHDREFYRTCVEDIISFLKRSNWPNGYILKPLAEGSA
jgi:succinate dehydrogenase/fumarate reductase flavoprotein subunit